MSASAVHSLCAAAGFMALTLILVVRLPHLIVLFIFVLFTFVWRTASTLYIDVAGPVFSSQLERMVGPGTSTVLQSICYFVTLAPFLFVFRLDAMQRLAQMAPKPANRGAAEITAGDAILLLSTVYVALLYFELMRIGVVPFVEGLERYDYTKQYGSLPHLLFVEKGNLIGFVWGATFTYTWIVERRFDGRFVMLVVAVCVYALLTGHRFSAFYGICAFFISPMAAILVLMQFPRHAMHSAVAFRDFRVKIMAVGLAASVGIAALVAVGLANNLVNVRGYNGAEVTERVLERALIQPSEMWWMTYERVFLYADWRPDVAYRLLFVSPIDAERNTTAQFLMSKAISPERTYHHILNGFQFAGGFPEVFFELFGRTWAWPIMFVLGLCTATLLYVVLRSIIVGALITAFLAQYVLYGLFVMYIGGMLNFTMPWTYWLKVATLVLALAIEWGTPVRILPWRLLECDRERKPPNTSLSEDSR